MIKDIHLHAVTSFIELNLENDRELQEIIELASAVSNTPYACISVLDKETQYLKVKKGINEVAIPREISFCTHTINQNDIMVVPNLLKDERFINNPWVSGNPGLRFYAGMPISTRSGQKLGALCVLDVKQRSLNKNQQQVIKILANQVMNIMEHRVGMETLLENQKELEEQKALNDDANTRLRSFFESSVNFHVLLGKNGEVIDFNKTAFNYIKSIFKTELGRGQQLIKYIHHDFAVGFNEKYKRALQGEKSLGEGSFYYEETGLIWFESTIEPAYDKHGEIIGASYVLRNVTDRKLNEQKILAQNQSLLKIAHIQAHEFRGPLTSIMGLISLIKQDDYSAPKEYVQLLEDAVYTLDDKIKQIVSKVDDTVTNDWVTT